MKRFLSPTVRVQAWRTCVAGLALVLGSACSSGSSSSTPATGTTDPGLPPVEVPTLSTLPELVPAFHQSVTTLGEAQAALGQAHQDLAKADPLVDQALFLQKSDAYVAAAQAFVHAGQVANGYGKQFPGFHKQNDGSNPVVSPEQLAALQAGQVRLAETLGKLKAQLDAGTISQETYDKAVWASGWKEWLARGVALPFTIAGKAADAAGGAVAAVKGYTLATSLGAAGAGGVASQVTAGAVATAGVEVVAAAGVTWAVCKLCGKVGQVIGGTKAETQGWCISTGIEFGPGSIIPVPVGSSCTIDIPGKPPLFIDSIPGPAGGVVKVEVEPGDVDGGKLNGPPVLTPVDPSVFSSCSSIFAVSASTEPPDPAPGQSVTVIAVAVPPVAGCSMSFHMTGTDKFAKEDTVQTDAAGQATFVIPGGAADVVDTVIVQVGGHETTLTYTF